MEAYKTEKLNQIIEALNMKTTSINRMESKVDKSYDQRILRALDDANIGYFEWSETENCVYMSGIALKYSGIDDHSNISFFDQMFRVFDEERLYEFLNNLADVVSGEVEKVEFEMYVDAKIYNTFRSIKFNIRREIIDEKLLITGTAQDITEVRSLINELAESENMIKQVVDAVPIPIFYVDNSGEVEFANNASENKLSICYGDKCYMEHKEYHSKLLSMFNVIHTNMIDTNENHKKYEIYTEKDNDRYDILIDEVNIFDTVGDIIGRVFVHTDLTERTTHVERVKKLLKANELLLHIAGMIDEKANIEDMYREILKGVLDVVTKADKGCIILFDKEENIYIKESIGFGDEYVKEFRIPFKESFAKKFLNGNYLRAVRITSISENYDDKFPDINNIKRGFRLESNITAPINVNGKLFGIISVDSSKKDAFDDIDLNLIDFLRGKLELSINRLKGLSEFVETSQRDELTGLYNRRYFLSVLESMMSSVNENEKFSLVVFDLDDLKVINDNLGHLAGDIMIKSFVKELRDNFRDKDILARLGGDEFIGLFKNIDNEVLIKKITEIEMKLYEKPIKYEENHIYIGFSYGISIYPEDGNDLEHLFHIADDRMYLNKARKKSQK